jgi:hypothetical protein
MAVMRGMKITQLLIAASLIFLQGFTFAQEKITDGVKKQKWILGGIQAGFWAGSFYTLNKAWYANYPRSSFHFYNDWKEWQQMDKVGHFWSAYQLSRLSGSLWRAAGSNQKSAALIGSLTSMGYMGVIEILDGYSDKWGFSGYDILSNSIGASAYLAQELAWKEQRISLKLSYSPVRYGTLTKRANELFGSGDMEKILKDYNGQTYWTSFNIGSFFPQSRAPKWLNLSLGYGAKTMLGGYENKWADANGNIVTRFDIPRYKRFYLSLDVDLTRIPSHNKFIKTIFSMANVLKIPAPAFELNTKGEFKFHPFFY